MWRTYTVAEIHTIDDRIRQNWYPVRARTEKEAIRKISGGEELPGVQYLAYTMRDLLFQAAFIATWNFQKNLPRDPDTDKDLHELLRNRED